MTSTWISTWNWPKSRSNENPVYYIQYAHARVSSVLRQLKERGMTHERRALASHRLPRLKEPQETAIAQAHQRLSRSRQAMRRRSARPIRWCITCAIWRMISIPITARTNSSSRMPACRAARPRSRACHADRGSQRPHPSGRFRARHHVSLMGARLQNQAQQTRRLLRLARARLRTRPRAWRRWDRVFEGSSARCARGPRRQGRQKAAARQ